MLSGAKAKSKQIGMACTQPKKLSWINGTHRKVEQLAKRQPVAPHQRFSPVVVLISRPHACMHY